MRLLRHRALTGSAVALAALVLAACGGEERAGSTAATTAAPPPSAGTVLRGVVDEALGGEALRLRIAAEGWVQADPPADGRAEAMPIGRTTLTGHAAVSPEGVDVTARVEGPSVDSDDRVVVTPDVAALRPARLEDAWFGSADADPARAAALGALHAGAVPLDVRVALASLPTYLEGTVEAGPEVDGAPTWLVRSRLTEQAAAYLSGSALPVIESSGADPEGDAAFLARMEALREGLALEVVADRRTGALRALVLRVDLDRGVLDDAPSRPADLRTGARVTGALTLRVSPGGAVVVDGDVARTLRPVGDLAGILPPPGTLPLPTLLRPVATAMGADLTDCAPASDAEACLPPPAPNGAD